jgi:hypothetical protein
MESIRLANRTAGSVFVRGNDEAVPSVLGLPCSSIVTISTTAGSVTLTISGIVLVSNCT